MSIAVARAPAPGPPRFAVLLAKWTRTPDQPEREAARLRGHLADVTAIAEEIAKDWGAHALATVGLDPATWVPRLQQALPRAAFLHDFGKANDHFQRMIRRPGAVTQAFRHELISLWAVLSFPRFSDWLCAECDDVTQFAVLAAVAGHHLKIGGDLDLQARAGSETSSLWFLGAHHDVADSLARTSVALRLGAPPAVTDVAIPLTTRNPLSVVRDWLADSEDWWHAQDRDTRVFVALVKALLIGADVAGSAVPKKQNADCRAWAHETLHSVCSQAELDQVVADRLRPTIPPVGTYDPDSERPTAHASVERPEQQLRPFQREVRDSPARVTFVRAGCGSGKTLAAYVWAARRAVGRKLFFTYPTTGTTTAGFTDYVLGVEGVEAALVHSRASVDLADLLENREDDNREGVATTTDQLMGLESWKAQVTVSTVDAVLGLIQNRRRGLFSSPALVNGAFVFDEIHQYDDELFDALVHFLEVFRGAPILLMTASLQASRFERLRATLGYHGEELGVVSGPPDLEGYARYTLATVDQAKARAAAGEALKSSQKVLWVSNRVRRCQTVGAASGGTAAALLYHSRYRYVDRVQRHRSVIEGFGAYGAVLASTTQVCEVSLDLSADLLITDLATVPALIQRLGRLNRVHPDSGPKQALVIPVDDKDALPYTDSDLALARAWLAELGNGPVSQRDLASAFERLAPPDPPRQHRGSAWIEGGPVAAPAELREAGTTINVLRAEDAADRSAEAVLRNAIPMPLQPVLKEFRRWERAGAALIAPAGRIQYDPLTGAAWT